MSRSVSLLIVLAGLSACRAESAVAPPWVGTVLLVHGDTVVTWQAPANYNVYVRNRWWCGIANWPGADSAVAALAWCRVLVEGGWLP